LGIGNEHGRFTRQAAPFVGAYVVITGTVTNKCRDRGVPSCLHGSTDIEPTDVTAGQAHQPLGNSMVNP
jgi:hypothetical protein